MSQHNHTTPHTPDTPWWDAFYHDTLGDFLLERESTTELDDIAQFLTRHLHIQPTSTLFDQCCGIGNISLTLAQHGASGWGVDYADVYIQRAQHTAQRTQAPFVFQQGDAFTFTTPTPCDAAFNWGSSFGYALTDDENIEMFHRAFESLKPGAFFALDVPNMVGVLRHFQPTMSRRRTLQQGDVLLLRESTIRLDRGTLEQVWTWFLPDGTRKTNTSRLRIYLPDHIATLLRKAGFETVGFFADIHDTPLHMDSLRCIITARRPL